MTRKDCYTFGLPVYQTGYCNIQSASKALVYLGSNSGIYGWNWDAFLVPGVAVITTGYRNLTGELLEDSTNVDADARDIWNNWKTPYEERKDFIMEMVKTLF